MLTELYRIRVLMKHSPELLQEKIHHRACREIESNMENYLYVQLTDGAIVVQQADVLLSLTLAGIFIVTANSQRYVPWANLRASTLDGWLEHDVVTKTEVLITELREELHPKQEEHRTLEIEEDAAVTTHASEGSEHNSQPAVVSGKGIGTREQIFTAQKITSLDIFEAIRQRDTSSKVMQRYVSAFCKRMYFAKHLGTIQNETVTFTREEGEIVLSLTVTEIAECLGTKFNNINAYVPEILSALESMLQ